MQVSTNIIIDIESGKVLRRDCFEYAGPVARARGAATAAQNSLNSTEGQAGTSQGQANTLQSGLLPSYTSMMDTGYLNPQQQAAAMNTEMGAATQPFESAKTSMTNNAAASNNAAGLTAGQDKLALEEGVAGNEGASNLQNQQMQNQMAGAAGVQGLQSQDTSEAENMYGLSPSTINAWSGAQMNNPALQFTETALAAAGKGAGTAAGG